MNQKDVEEYSSKSIICHRVLGILGNQFQDSSSTKGNPDECMSPLG